MDLRVKMNRIDKSGSYKRNISRFALAYSDIQDDN